MGAKFSSSLWIPTSGSTTQVEEIGYTPASGFQDTIARTYTASTSVKGINASGANTAGSNLIVSGGLGTGSASGGRVRIQSSFAGGAGSSLNPAATLVDVAASSGGYGAILFEGSKSVIYSAADGQLTAQNSAGTADLFTSTTGSTSTSGTVNGNIFAPSFSDGGTNSTTTARGFYINPTVNYTGASRTGSVTALQIDQVGTSNPTGTNYLILARAGAAGTTSIFSVTNSGRIVTESTASSQECVLLQCDSPDTSVSANCPTVSRMSDLTAGGAAGIRGGLVMGMHNGTTGANCVALLPSKENATANDNRSSLVFSLNAGAGGGANAFNLRAAVDSSGNFRMPTGGTYSWTSSSSDPTVATALDTIVSRRAAGQVSFDTTAAGNGLGAFFASRVQVDRTTNLSVTAAATNTVYTNTGAGGAVVFTLPTAAVGLTYTFIVNAAQTLQVTAGASTTITIGNTASAAAGNITNASVGSAVTLHAVSTTKWIASSSTGTWTIT